MCSEKRVMRTFYSVQREGVKAIPRDVGLPMPRFFVKTCLTRVSSMQVCGHVHRS